MSINGTTDKVVINAFFTNNDPANATNPVQQFRFADGSVWNGAAILAQMEAQRPKYSPLGSEDARGSAPALAYADQQAMAAAFKPYEISASSPLLDNLGVAGPGAGAAGSETLDSQVQQLLSAMASFAPGPGVQTKGFADASQWQLVNPIVAANAP